MLRCILHVIDFFSRKKNQFLIDTQMAINFSALVNKKIPIQHLKPVKTQHVKEEGKKSIVQTL